MMEKSWYGVYEIDGGGKRAFRCGTCGYEIEDEDQNYIEDGQFLADWLLTYCEEDQKI